MSGMNCKLRRLVRLGVSLNVLVIACFWMGHSECVFPLSDWRGLVYDNIALLAGMASCISIGLMCLKPNACSETRRQQKQEGGPQ